ncbi:hypothetical protein PDESU_05505 [Pontiella desulfatans]|uniref:Uncharacterized protein n=1 Tax=Pontiella desulfatans TaxID=2750659 RepID=A0A6C2UAM7_PONDE|nr:hypothetical protein [Pontiella desulfatans]VGO16913.1 hypothetical protein PDESU_05505 [Pontiella desulfatans]
MPTRLTASVGRKEPGDREFSSKSYHASLEKELPSDLNAEQLKSEIHQTYARLEQAIDEQISGKVTRLPQRQGQQRRQRAPEGPASQKQTAYLLDLATARNVTLAQLNAEVQQRFGVDSIYMLDRVSCSKMIDHMQQQKAA